MNALLMEMGVAAGTDFGDSAGLRVSYGAPADKLKTGRARLVKGLNAWQ
ncbi:hypothetical protein PY650_30100 [Rhizobium calliandrae]|uniref:Aspartate aminotransferase n=1 Tax=Rhizobium calliandrae TaxID=1312182 RepID=A0ABT7KMD4_9HYPH|nr:hypothetical protein [Rhizobium calliandrae]MDL2409798.1 hypothetical protein [Rhizobium calliandrae]